MRQTCWESSEHPTAADREPAIEADDQMKKIVVETKGVLYRNPIPGYKAECAYLPNVVPLSQKELICFYRIGQAFYSIDGRLAKLRSTDGALTWEQEGLVWDPQDDHAPYSYSAPHGTRLSDGTLLLIARRSDGADPERLMFNPQTAGIRPTQAVLFRSSDNGRTWSKPQVLDLPGEGTADTPSQIIELNNGRLFLACEQWKAWDDDGPLHIKGFAVFSDDNASTWSDRIDFPSATDPEKMFSHSRYTPMLDGRICALQWTQQIGAEKDYDLHFTISDQTGTNWTYPRPTGIMGQTSWVADLGNGRLAAAYTRREGMQPGIIVALSEDEGNSWDLENQAIVWDAVGQEYLGVVHKPSYPASHDNIAFGKPNLARLHDGTLICSWWCTQACVTHARFAKLRIE